MDDYFVSCCKDIGVMWVCKIGIVVYLVLVYVKVRGIVDCGFVRYGERCGFGGDVVYV